MLDRIGEEDEVPKYVDMAKDSTSSFRIMGFGHRVYKNYDPRAKVMQDMCYAVIEANNADKTEDSKTSDETREKNLAVALALEKVALDDEYFKKRKLFPNVDFYSGIVL